MRTENLKETDIMRLIMMECSRLGATVWRNNVGTGYTSNGSFIRFGLCKGSSDLIGLYKGRFLAIEVKDHKGKVTTEQKNYIDFINKNGGIAGVCRNLDDLKKLLDI